MDSSKKKKIKVIGVPIDLGSKPLGVEMGPAAIRYAGIGEALECNGFQYLDIGDLVISGRGRGRGKNQVDEIARVSEELTGLVADTLLEGGIPLVMGGDHSASIGSIAGAAKACERLGLLWLDCHPDANTPETSPTGNVHGMTVAISLGFGHPKLVNCGGFSPKVSPEDVCIIGAKDIDPGEKEFLKRTGVRCYSTYDITRRGIVEVLDEAIESTLERCDAVHLSFDVDVLDPVIAPGTGILSRGGLSYREISYVMRTIGDRDVIRSCDIIEINPLLDTQNETAELAVELMLAALGGEYGEYERHYLKNMR